MTDTRSARYRQTSLGTPVTLEFRPFGLVQVRHTSHDSTLRYKVSVRCILPQYLFPFPHRLPTHIVDYRFV